MKTIGHLKASKEEQIGRLKERKGRKLCNCINILKNKRNNEKLYFSKKFNFLLSVHSSGLY